jgi:chemotaxis protein CheX
VEKVMTISLRDSVQLISAPRNLDASVEEVFRTMLGVNCRPVPSTSDFGSGMELVTVVTGFGGMLSGACVFKCDARTAMRIAELMTEIHFAEVDETVKDGIGELGNLLAGTWKGQLPDLAAHCGLSIPAVITGRDYKLRKQARVRDRAHVFARRFDVHGDDHRRWREVTDEPAHGSPC